jgi:predicted transcriptional regulator
MGNQPEPLGQVQLEVLRYVVKHHPITVSQVADHFATTAGKARTTILTVMEKLRQKRYLTRKRRGGTFHYSPRMSAADLMVSVVGRFVDESLGGSVSPFIAYLSETKGLSDAEIAQLKDLVSELEPHEKKGEL